MIVHPEHTLKIEEFHHDHIIVYESIDDWCQYGTLRAETSEHIRCTQCEMSYSTVAQFNGADCYGRIVHRSKNIPHPNGHDLVRPVIVRDEFGYTFSKEELGYIHEVYRSKRRRSYPTGNWHNEAINPEYRGILPINRTDGSYQCKYKHNSTHLVNFYGYVYRHRSPKTFQERRMVDATTYDEFSPTVRGRRTVRGLPTSWDDVHCNLQRTWKKRKVRNQWMVNLHK